MRQRNVQNANATKSQTKGETNDYQISHLARASTRQAAKLAHTTRQCRQGVARRLPKARKVNANLAVKPPISILPDKQIIKRQEHLVSRNHRLAPRPTASTYALHSRRIASFWPWRKMTHSAWAGERLTLSTARLKQSEDFIAAQVALPLLHSSAMIAKAGIDGNPSEAIKLAFSRTPRVVRPG